MSLPLVIIFFVVALLYASAGFGGGSSYIAFLAIYEVDYRLIPIYALVCNLVVVSGGSYFFIRKKLLPWGSILPLLITSVPAAFLGASVPISRIPFLVILGLVLISAGLVLFSSTLNKLNISEKKNITGSLGSSMLLGTALGGVSGLVGIGGGIFLSPILHFLKWGHARSIAAMASFFILVNSCAGLLGQLHKHSSFNFGDGFIWLPAVVLAGGLIGSRFSASMLSSLNLKRLTSLLVFAAGLRILIKVAGF